jgi:hypothetical protein
VKRRIPQPLLIALIALGFVLVGLGGWFLVIGPQRAHAGDLDKQIVDTNDAIAAARALTLEAKKGARIRVATSTGSRRRCPTSRHAGDHSRD